MAHTDSSIDGGGPASPTIESVVVEQSGLVIASLVSTFRDLDLAEDAFQEAALAAFERWPRDGLPERPGAWLTTTARRRAIDRLRRARTRREAIESGALADPFRDATDEDLAMLLDAPIEDERLRLVFTCCHPALPVEARVALTLRLLGGLSTEQVARAFFVSEATMAKRLVRAKKKIAQARIPYRVPTAEELPDRLPSVLLVVYLVFSQGAGSSEEGGELAAEALRLGRLLHALMPEEPEVGGLFALMSLVDARRDARLAGGAWVPLERQDPARWDWVAIRDGLGTLTRALRAGRPGPYQLQAAIAAKHAERAERGSVPWAEIVELYAALESVDPRPVVRLNAALASAHVDGAEAGLGRLEQIEAEAPGDFDDYQPWHAARAWLLAEAGRTDEALAAFARAIDGAPGQPERRYLEAERDRVAATG